MSSRQLKKDVERPLGQRTWLLTERGYWRHHSRCPDTAHSMHCTARTRVLNSRRPTYSYMYAARIKLKVYGKELKTDESEKSVITSEGAPEVHSG